MVRAMKKLIVNSIAIGSVLFTLSGLAFAQETTERVSPIPGIEPYVVDIIDRLANEMREMELNAPDMVVDKKELISLLPYLFNAMANGANQDQVKTRIAAQISVPLQMEDHGQVTNYPALNEDQQKATLDNLDYLFIAKKAIYKQ